MKDNNWKTPNRIEKRYETLLTKMLKPLQEHIKDLGNPSDIVKALTELFNSPMYKEQSEKVAFSIVTMLFDDSAKTWRSAARKSSRGKELYNLLSKELKGPMLGALMEQADRNANIIKTLPLDISKRVTQHTLSESMAGKRASEIAKEIKEFFPKTTKARASLIARTETSKTTTALTRARAEILNLNWYIWRTSEDQRVRGSHHHMKGVLVNWNNPPAPELLIGKKSEGYYQAGEIYNCRCYPEPLIRLDQISWPHKVYYHGKIQTMTLNQFKQIA